MTRSKNETSSGTEPIHDVVTAFVYHGSRVLLALRSQAVSTFPGHWAGISGYLENEPPVERAVIELEEECGFDRTEVLLRGEGEPFLAGEGPRFRVYPFLFSVEPSCEPRRDWEAQRFKWVEVAELLAGRIQPTVPKLLEGFHRVWPAWPAELVFDKNLDLIERWLREDRTQGAGSLARSAARHFAKFVRLVSDETFQREKPRLCEAARRIGAARSSMAAPGNMMHDLAGILQTSPSREDFILRIADRITAAAAAEQQAAQRVAEALSPSSMVMTISYSGTVRQSLLAAKDKLAGVFICEGRPLCEGRELATELARAGIAVTVLTDAQMLLKMTETDVVLLGADTVLGSGAVINKVGSALLALAARRFDRPVWAVTTTLKIARIARDDFPQEENSPLEVWAAPPVGVTISNQYFERVPPEVVTALFTETARLVPADVAASAST